MYPNNAIKKLVKYAADQFAFRETRMCWPINGSRKIHLHIFKHSQIIKNSNFFFLLFFFFIKLNTSRVKTSTKFSFTVSYYNHQVHNVTNKPRLFRA